MFGLLLTQIILVQEQRDPQQQAVGLQAAVQTTGEAVGFASHLKQRYLQPLTRRPPSVDAVVSFRPAVDGQTLQTRDWYNAWLTYWPIDLGQIIFYADEGDETVRKLQGCLEITPRMCPTLRVHFASTNHNRYLQRAHDEPSKHNPMRGVEWSNDKSQNMSASEMGIALAQISMWKFDADGASEAEVLAFTDDDSCMQDYVLPSEIVNAFGQLSAKGVIKPTPENYSPNDVNALEALGLSPIVAEFMVDFPVYVWREMLVDFRSHVVQAVFPKRTPKPTDDEKALFWKAWKALSDRGIHLNDYAMLLTFAYRSPKWYPKYDWQLYNGSQPGDFPITSHASHYRGLGCVSPANDTSIKVSDPQTRASATVAGLLYPAARSPSNAKMIASSIHKLAGVMESNEWRQHLLDRQVALKRYASTVGDQISVRDSCGTAVGRAWDQCFVQLRTPGIDVCTWCRKAPANAMPRGRSMLHGY